MFLGYLPYIDDVIFFPSARSLPIRTHTGFGTFIPSSSLDAGSFQKVPESNGTNTLETTPWENKCMASNGNASGTRSMERVRIRATPLIPVSLDIPGRPSLRHASNLREV